MYGCLCVCVHACVCLYANEDVLGYICMYVCTRVCLCFVNLQHVCICLCVCSVYVNVLCLASVWGYSSVFSVFVCVSSALSLIPYS